MVSIGRYRLAVRTLRCGRNNPGSNPGSVIFVMDFRSISLQCIVGHRFETPNFVACLAQSVERQALNLMVVGSSPTVGAFYHQIRV